MQKLAAFLPLESSLCWGWRGARMNGENKVLLDKQSITGLADITALRYPYPMPHGVQYNIRS